MSPTSPSSTNDSSLSHSIISTSTIDKSHQVVPSASASLISIILRERELGSIPEDILRYLGSTGNAEKLREQIRNFQENDASATAEISLEIDLARNGIRNLPPSGNNGGSLIPVYFHFISHLNLEFNQLENITLSVFPNLLELNLHANQIHLDTLDALQSETLRVLTLRRNPIVKEAMEQGEESIRAFAQKLQGLEALNELMLFTADDSHDNSTDAQEASKLLREALVNELDSLIRIDDTWMMDSTITSSMHNASPDQTYIRELQDSSLHKETTQQGEEDAPESYPVQNSSSPPTHPISHVATDTLEDTSQLLQDESTLQLIDNQQLAVSLPSQDQMKETVRQFEEYKKQLLTYEESETPLPPSFVQKLKEFVSMLAQEFTHQQETQSIVQKQMYKATSIVNDLIRLNSAALQEASSSAQDVTSTDASPSIHMSTLLENSGNISTATSTVPVALPTATGKDSSSHDRLAETFSRIVTLITSAESIRSIASGRTIQIDRNLHPLQQLEQATTQLQSMHKKLELQYQILEELKKNYESMRIFMEQHLGKNSTFQDIQTTLSTNQQLYKQQTLSTVASLLQKAARSSSADSSPPPTFEDESSLVDWIKSHILLKQHDDSLPQLDENMNEIRQKMQRFEELNQKMIQTEKKNRHLEDQIVRLRHEVQTNQESSFDMSMQLQTEQEKATSANQTVEKYAKELQDADQRYIQIKQQYDHLNQKLARLEQENTELRSDLDETTRQLDQASDSTTVLDDVTRNSFPAQMHGSLSYITEGSEGKTSSKQSQYSEGNQSHSPHARNSSQKQQIKLAQQELKQLLEDIEKARSLARIEQEQYDACVESHRQALTEFRNLEAQKHNLEEQVFQLNAESKRLSQESKKQREQISKHKEETLHMQKEHQSAEDTLDALEQKLTLKQQEVASVRDSLSELSLTRDRLKRRLSEMQAKLLDKESDLGQLHEQCHKVEDRIQERQNDLHNLDMNIKSFQHELNATRDSNKEILTLMEKRSTEALQLKHEIQSLQKDKEHMLESVEHVRERKALLEEQMQDMVDLVQHAKTELENTSRAREENQEFFTELDAIHDKIKNASEQLQKTEQAQNTIIHERDQLREEIQALKESYESLLEEDWQRDVLQKLKQMQQEQILRGGTYKDIELVVCSKEEFEGFKSQIASLDKQIAQLEEEKSEQMMKRRALELDLDDLRNEKKMTLTKSNSQLEEQQNTVSQLKKTISQLQEDIQKKQMDIELRQQKLLDSEQQYKLWKERCNATSEEVREKAKQCIAAQTINTRLQKQIASLKEQLQRQQKRYASSARHFSSIPSHTLQAQLDLKDMKIQQLQQQCDSLFTVQQDMLENDSIELKQLLRLFQKEYARVYADVHQVVFSHSQDLESIKYAFAEKEENLKVQLQVLQDQIQNKEKQFSIRTQAMEKEITHLSRRVRGLSPDSEEVARGEYTVEKYLDEMRELCNHYSDQSSYINELMETIQTKDNQIIELLSKTKQMKISFDNKSAQQQEFVKMIREVLEGLNDKTKGETVTIGTQSEPEVEVHPEIIDSCVQTSQPRTQCKPIQTTETGSTKEPASPSADSQFTQYSRYEALLHADDPQDRERAPPSKSADGSCSSADGSNSTGGEILSVHSSTSSSISYLKETVKALTGILKEKNEYIRDLEVEFCKVHNEETVHKFTDDKTIQCTHVSGDISRDALRYISTKSLIRLFRKEVKKSTLSERHRKKFLKLIDRFWTDRKSSCGSTEFGGYRKTMPVQRDNPPSPAGEMGGKTVKLPRMLDTELQQRVNRFLSASLDESFSDIEELGSEASKDISDSVSQEEELLQSLRRDLLDMDKNLALHKSGRWKRPHR